MAQGDDRSSRLGLERSDSLSCGDCDQHRLHAELCEQAIRKLREAGLLERVDEGYYEITDEGRAYLEGARG